MTLFDFVVAYVVIGEIFSTIDIFKGRNVWHPLVMISFWPLVAFLTILVFIHRSINDVL